ncbi:MAG: cytochrome c oxidase assembly protein [Halomonadaceae bacterium]|nr:MAG: cytochrome c oxidase assembly protein [Halomonadaceae bacterium]
MNETKPGSNKRVLGWSAFAIVGMFAFGFALVPLYDVMCEALGINGKTGSQYTVEAPDDMRIDTSRTIRVQFTAQNGLDMPWEFSADQRSIEVHPGEMAFVEFIAHNPTDQVMTAQAIPSLSPSSGTNYFHKTECFCFQEQKLEPGETVRMPLVFFVDDLAPASLHRVTLNYTIYEQSRSEQVAPVAKNVELKTTDRG